MNYKIYTIDEIKKRFEKNIDVITTDAELEEKFERESKKDLVKIYGWNIKRYFIRPLSEPYK